MDEGAEPDDDLAWPAPGPPPPPVASGPGPQGGATVAAGLFGALAGLTLPPLLFWIALTLFGALGAPDGLAALAALGVGFGLPVALLLQTLGLLRRSSPGYHGARTALTVAGSVTLGLWLLITAIGVVVILVLRSMG